MIARDVETTDRDFPRFLHWAWYAWPLGFLLALSALVYAYRLTHPTGRTEQMVMINAIQNTFDAPKFAALIAVFAMVHILLNLGFLFFDRSRPLPRRALHALSMTLSFTVLAGCTVVAALYLKR